jgi:hypothetical protein
MTLYSSYLIRTQRGVPSAIQIAAAVAAYASASMFKFLNIPGNPLIYSDTDSVVPSKNIN